MSELAWCIFVTIMVKYLLKLKSSDYGLYKWLVGYCMNDYHAYDCRLYRMTGIHLVVMCIYGYYNFL